MRSRRLFFKRTAGVRFFGVLLSLRRRVDEFPVANHESRLRGYSREGWDGRLGTNDLKRRFGVPAEDIARGAARLVGIARQSMCGPRGDAPQVLLVAPPPTTKLTRFSEMFEGAGEKSRRFGARFQAQAEEIGCPLLNAADEVVTSDLYGIHLEADQHQRLGRAVALRVRELLE